MARSMGEVVEASAIPLIEDPDDAVVWGVALGLQDEVEGVLAAVRRGPVRRAGRTTPYMPLWYSAGGMPGGGDSGGGGGWAPGLMSSSPIPNFGGMMAALGTIGNSPLVVGLGRRGRRLLGRRLRRGRRAARAAASRAVGRAVHSGPWELPTRWRSSSSTSTTGDVDAAVALMDERVEMRIHVGDNARTLRGVEQVGGWFLRADKGLKMVPGDVRDMGNTYQADLVVVRPGCAQPAPRRPVPRRGRQDHLDQPDALLALAASRRTPAAPRPRSQRGRQGACDSPSTVPSPPAARPPRRAPGS